MNILTFNKVALTEKTIQETRKWFSDNALACIEEVKNGKVWVNDENYYFEWRNKEAKEYLEGKYDFTLAFLQRAYYIQTGDCVPLLP